MRRFWSVLFVSVLILSMVAGCAVPTTPAPAAEAPAAAQPAVEAPAAAPEAAPTEAPMAEAPVEAAPMTGECVNDATGETIGVYQQAGLTGALSTILGPGFINGSKDAVADINSHGGVCGAMLEIHLEDTQYDPEQELAVYEKFRAETPKPMFILSYGSGAAIVLKDRTVEDQIVNITAGLNADAFYNPADGWTVGVAPIYSDQFAGFLQWAHDNWATIKPAGAGDDIVVGVVGWANSFGAGATTPEAIAYAEALGITVLPLEQQDISPSADVTGQLQNLLVGGANIIWSQALSFGPVQVIGTLRALGVWDQVVVGGVNWAMNQDVLTILGDNAGLASGFYGVFPYLYWNDTDAPGVQKALAAFEAGGHPAADKGVGYLLSYGSLYAVQTILTQAMNNVGYDGLDGMAFYDALKELGTVSAGGLFDLDVTNGNRAPQQSQIRQVQAVDGELQFVVVEDFFQLPDTRPGQ
ncbi:MAG: ABC transporter substrate-binding protein [Caldilineaceae bacterium]|nr:ABC transporter substrate-binding protein [Caldilineaceae bacterium]MBP8109223.1 ABC transporter substrate-binding protein [Caldilineaceae bacterium]MBP8122724.1 ABC transporter substrate-binding protein [Caldilineaceae bacterium]MBP9072194.1 ABC transporter substrate-binding protein [Caldilineaceae bacterium]